MGGQFPTSLLILTWLEQRSSCPDVSQVFTGFWSARQSLPIIPIMFMIYWIGGGREAVICLCQQGKVNIYVLGNYFQFKNVILWIYELVLRIRKAQHFGSQQFKIHLENFITNIIITNLIMHLCFLSIRQRNYSEEKYWKQLLLVVRIISSKEFYQTYKLVINCENIYCCGQILA